MFLRLWLPRYPTYDDTFFWSGVCRDNEVRLYPYKKYTCSTIVSFTLNAMKYEWLLKKRVHKNHNNRKENRYPFDEIRHFWKWILILEG